MAAVREHRPDVVLMDIRMAEMDGITATAALRRLDRPPQVIVLTTFQADEQVMSALRAGASGFLVKDTPPAEIINAVRVGRLAATRSSRRPSPAPCCPTSATREASERPTARPPSGSPPSPTANVRSPPPSASGASNAEVAAALFMSEATVKAHVSRLLTKLDVANRVQIAILVHDATHA